MVDVNDSVESIISAVLLLAAIAGGLWLSLPFTWAQPQADASCASMEQSRKQPPAGFLELASFLKKMRLSRRPFFVGIA